MKDIVIVGHGGFAREVAFVIEEINRKQETWKLLGFISDDPQEVGAVCGKYKVIESDQWLESIDKELNVVIAIGNPPVIHAVKEKLEKNKNLVFPNLIHPNAVYDRDGTSFGVGNIVCAGTIFTTDITVGSCNIFNLSCTIGHDVAMGDCIVLNPTVNVSGGVIIGSKTLIGTGAKVLQNLSICDDTTIGAGAVVVKNIEEPGTYVGIPARKLQK